MNEVIEGLRLSPQQRHVWSLQQHDRVMPYRTQAMVRIDGPLDVASLLAAIERVVQQHEILRTTFCCLPGMTIPLQVINDRKQPLVVQLDLEGLEPERQETQIENLFSEMRRTAFDLEGGPLLHVSLVKISADRNMLLIASPAMNEDEAGLRNLVREIVAVLSGESLARQPMQYADSSEWNNDLLEAPERKEGRAYWREQDFSAGSALDLPFKNANEREFTPEFISIQIEQTAALEALAEKHNTSAALVLLACWQVLLWRLTSHPQIVVGCATDGRTHEELKTALGLFERYLPVQADLHGDVRFIELLKQLGRALRESGEYQEYYTLGEPEEERAASYFPLCYEYVGAAESCEAAGVKFTIVKEYGCTERYEVKLRCVGGEEGLRLEFHYDGNRYDEADVQRLAAQYERLLTSVLGDAERPLAELEVVSEPERQQQLEQWNETAVAYGPAVSLVELFEQQAAARPEAEAVVCGAEKLTYEELNRRANQLGHYLRRMGVGPEVRVGLCVERSVAMVVGVLGILKAGGAYVPLDPSYPQARVEQMLRDCGARVLLTEAHLAAQLPRTDAAVVYLGQQWQEIAAESETNPAVVVAGENLAYVIYTSGSTGQPKGVGVTQQNLVHTTRAREVYYGGAPESFLLLSSIAFDSSVAGLFWTLCGGGRLIVPAEGQQREARRLVQLVREQQVTHLLSLPSLYALLLEEADGGELAGLQGVIVAGEACGPALVERHETVVPQAVLYNEYGPTEGSVWSTVQQCRGCSGTVPIGRPIANVRLYVLDERQAVLPLGVSGELYVGGAGVTRGYLNDAALTAQKYVPDPYGGERGGRLYRTGDVGRYRRGGELEFVGRVDGQVKVRGYRVEVGEIEAVLEGHGSVQGAVVMVRASERGEAQLVGYVVGQEVSGAELRQWLGERLPEYMVPSRVLVLREWPLMPNGKVDRQRLPEAEAVNEGERRQARTAVEAVLQSIWEEVLGVRELSVTANFFELGGHSLLATQVMSRVREALQVEMPVRSLFAEPTVRGLAAEIELQLQAAEGMRRPPLRRGLRDGELPLSYAQQRLWFADQLTRGSAIFNVAVAVRLNGELNVTALARTLREIIARHEVLRTIFPAREGQPVQVIVEQVEFELPVTDLRELDQAEREQVARRLAEEEAQTRFDLATGPLVRARLLRLEEAEHVALFTMHHIVSDGWSKGVLIKEVSQLYEAYSRGEESPLTELPIQYADYAVWQREWLTGEVLDKQLEYWREQLAGAPETLALPADRERPAIQSFRGGRYPVAFTPELTENLKSLSRRESATLFMTLLTGFKILLHYYSKEDDIVVGANVANRNQAETEALIGFFVNTVVLRTDLSGDPTFVELLKRLREVCLEAYAHQDVPFEKVVALLQPERNLSRQPLFQVKIDLDDGLMNALELRGLMLTPFELPNDVGKYDFQLLMTTAGEGLRGDLVYNKDLFAEATVSMMSGQLGTLLHEIIKQPDARISVLEEVLAEADKQHQAGRETDYKNSIQQRFKQAKQKVATVS